MVTVKGGHSCHLSFHGHENESIAKGIIEALERFGRQHRRIGELHIISLQDALDAGIVEIVWRV